MVAAPPSLLLAELSWPDVQAALEAGFDTAIVPLGATEQHGPHLPAGTDTLRAEVLAVRIAARLGRALVAPAIPVGCSEEHREFPGTISLMHETLASVLVDIANSLARQGFQRIAILSAHGGNGRGVTMAVEALRSARPELPVWPPAERPQFAAVDSAQAQNLGIDPAEAGIHAGEKETSEVLALRPDLVALARAAAGYVGDMQAVLPMLRATGVRSVSPNGVLGDPRRGSGARGGQYLSAAVAALAAEIEDWRAATPAAMARSAE